VVGGWVTLGESSSFVDRVCKLPSDPGSACPPSPLGPFPEKLFYFDLYTEKCLSFSHLGCEGNQNRFASSEECIDSCQTPYFIKKNKEEDRGKPPGTGGEVHLKTDCLQPPIQGPCKALITMWFYNSTLGACEQFGYGGCDEPLHGNTNHFDTRLDCETFCGDNPPLPNNKPQRHHLKMTT